MQFDLTDLRLFVLAAEHRNLTRAAQAQHLSLAAASARIKSLEAQAGLPLHFVPAFGLALARLEVSAHDVQTMYLHMALRDQISAAIRLGVIGPMEGHRLQHDFYAVFDELLARHAGRGYQQATRSAFLLDTAQVFHDDIYSKLFQN